MTVSTQSQKETVARIVKESICSILPGLPAESIQGGKSLADHGADSVDRVEILLTIMGRLGMEEPMSNFSNIPNIEELVNYLCRAQQR